MTMAGNGRASRADNLSCQNVKQQRNASSGGPILQSNGCAIAGPLMPTLLTPDARAGTALHPEALS